MEYILDNGKDDGCFLCRAAEADEEDAASSFLVHKTDTTILIMNKFPYNNGHLLAAPIRHAADLTDLGHDEAAGLLEMTALAENLLRKVVSPHGFNIGVNVGAVSGAGLPGHIHVHIVPRWQGDTNFMPVTADTKIIPQALDALYKKLLEAQREVPG
jgi:ATP adenylyltransferase